MPEDLPAIGWREWVSLPALGVNQIKAKVDTGARSSALHASDVESFSRQGKKFVRFKAHPIQRDSDYEVQTEAEVLEERYVRSSVGHRSLRPVIIVNVEFMGDSWPIELTLVGRDEMGFRMLLGRQAIRGRFVVNPGRSYLGGRPKPSRKKRKKTNRSKKTTSPKKSRVS